PFFLVVSIRAPHTPYPGDDGVPAWRKPHDPDAIPVPATALDTPRFRLAHARMYDAYSLADDMVGVALDALHDAGLSASTLVIVTSDHGPALPASKGTLFEGGIHVPLVIRWPGVIAPGRSTDILVGGIDILPTLLEVAGAPIHPQIQGRSFAKVLQGERERLPPTSCSASRRFWKATAISPSERCAPTATNTSALSGPISSSETTRSNDGPRRC
ncbi:MAG: sulfatase-like hydrolase/transferase, partial [Myxococcales bacterium]|nr:sulfatase-like hydrolase/transferase [Myxococcales bacterium]